MGMSGKIRTFPESDSIAARAFYQSWKRIKSGWRAPFRWRDAESCFWQGHYIVIRPLFCWTNRRLALDALAESEIYEIYNRTLADITALFISHRLASTRFCKEILLLSDGKIAECGSHEELMEQKGKYYELFLVQSKYYGRRRCGRCRLRRCGTI